MAKKISKAEETGKQSIYEAEKEAKKLQSILDVIFNPDEIKTLWEKIDNPTTKMFIVRDMAKYVYKEKGKETDKASEDADDRIKRLEELKLEIGKLMGK